MGLFSKKICGICGQTIKGDYWNIHKPGKKKEIYYFICASCKDKFIAATGGKVAWPVDAEETKRIIEDKKSSSGIIETYKRCNVCGTIFCYSNKDLERNRALSKEADRARGMAIVDLFGYGGTIASNQESDKADRLESQMVDYSKCPKCHSSNLSVISAEEATKTKNNQQNNIASTTSVTDELKKYKELLDIGIITQEEFDSKKKQLLNL